MIHAEIFKQDTYLIIVLFHFAEVHYNGGDRETIKGTTGRHGKQCAKVSACYLPGIIDVLFLIIAFLITFDKQVLKWISVFAQISDICQ